MLTKACLVWFHIQDSRENSKLEGQKHGGDSQRLEIEGGLDSQGTRGNFQDDENLYFDDGEASILYKNFSGFCKCLLA